jgi:magnesium-transporting ATPase (P-type)
MNLVLLGLIGLLDPPRKEAVEAVKECHGGGIRVTMITGDHKITAAAIAKMLEIGDGKTATTGAEIAEMDTATLQERVRNVDVFARASPEHKLRLVKAIQANKQIVAMTGDGVNDAPALKKADIGVAMRIKGTEVTKEAAEMVLADDSFASITAAVKEGRTVYNNIEKAILFMLPTNVAQALVIMAAIFVGFTAPITAPDPLGQHGDVRRPGPRHFLRAARARRYAATAARGRPSDPGRFRAVGASSSSAWRCFRSPCGRSSG